MITEDWYIKPDGMHFDRAGLPISMKEWGQLGYGMDDYRRIGSTNIRRWWISTVWVGLDMSFRNGPPLIYETMIFWRKPKKGGLNSTDWCMRYSTDKEARRGHSEVCRMIHSGWRG